MIKDPAQLATEVIGKDTEKRLEDIYSKALKKALKNQASFLRKIESLDERAKNLPKDWTEQQIKSWKMGWFIEAERKAQVVASISKELERAGAEAANIIKDSANTIYGINWDYTRSQIESVTLNINFTIYDQNQIRAILLSEQTPFSKLAYKNLGRNLDIVRILGGELAQAVVLGEGQKKIINRIRKITEQSAYQAKRVAQTERNRVQSQARYDTAKEAAELGSDITKRWTARMHHTRETHAYLNGITKPLNEAFITVGGNSLMFPCDPNAPASEVINCHCVLITEVATNSQESRRIRARYEDLRAEQMEKSEYSQKTPLGYGFWREFL